MKKRIILYCKLGLIIGCLLVGGLSILINNEEKKLAINRCKLSYVFSPRYLESACYFYVLPKGCELTYQQLENYLDVTCGELSEK